MSESHSGRGPERAAAGISRREVLGGASVLAAAAALPQAAVAADAVPTTIGPLLKALDAVPPADQSPWVLDVMRKDPLPFFAELRKHRPNCEIDGAVLVSRYVDVVEIFRHPTVFSVALYKPKMGDFMLTHDETPTHRRDKSVMSAMLPLDDAPRVTALADKFASAAIQQSNGEIEIVAGLSRRVPIQIVQEYFGLDGVDEASLLKWSYWSQYDNFHNHTFQRRPRPC